MAIQGIDRVRRNLRVAVENIAGGVSERAVYEVLSQGAAMAQTMTPIDTSTLVNSQTPPPRSLLAQTGSRAASVTPLPTRQQSTKRQALSPASRETRMTLAGGDYWDPNAEPEFLTKGFDQIIPAIPAILRRTYRV